MKARRAPSGKDFFSEKLRRLEQLFEKARFGLSILDRDLRFIHVNDRMAAMDGIPQEQHIGKTVRELDRQLAMAVGPLLSKTIGGKCSFVEHEVVYRPLPDQSLRNRSWLLNCHLLKTDDGTVMGCGLIVQDTTGQKINEEIQTERVNVEALLSDLSTAFINIPVSDVDRKIEQGLQRVVEFLGFDRSTIWQVSPDDGRLLLTHSYAVPGIKKPSSVIKSSLMPIWNDLIRHGEFFKISNVDDLPDDYWREKKFCRDQGGIRSILFIPASVGGTVVGTITFVSYQVIREWPDELIQRLRLMWEIFANALERKRADEKIQNVLAEIERLKDRLEAENLYLRDQIGIEYKHEEIIGRSAAIQKVLLQIGQVAKTDSTVLVLGETGTGKELIARAIHNASARKARAMIKVDCASLPAALIEAELFGHEKGAYTGAVSGQIGRFEAADGSTIFLDEIGELPLELQSKLLRVLQEGQFTRLGSPKPVDVDVRVIAATNRNLAQAVSEGSFREDLYYRLNVFPISVPSLRERREDIPLLTWAMVDEFSRSFGKVIERIPGKNMEAMERYLWPGNIRELRNLVERAMILNGGATLVIDVPDTLAATAAQPMTLEGLERKHITAVLEKTGWRIRGHNGAAELLDMKPTTLHARIKKLGIMRKNHLSL